MRLTSTSVNVYHICIWALNCSDYESDLQPRLLNILCILFILIATFCRPPWLRFGLLSVFAFWASTLPYGTANGRPAYTCRFGVHSNVKNNCYCLLLTLLLTPIHELHYDYFDLPLCTRIGRRLLTFLGCPPVFGRASGKPDKKTLKSSHSVFLVVSERKSLTYIFTTYKSQRKIAKNTLRINSLTLRSRCWVKSDPSVKISTAIQKVHGIILRPSQ